MEEATTVTRYVSFGSYTEILIAPTEDGTWTFYSNASSDTYGYLCDGNGNTIISDDDSGSGTNFSMTYNLEAGEVYILNIRWWSSSNSGNIPVVVSVS